MLVTELRHLVLRNVMAKDCDERLFRHMIKPTARRSVLS
jgi:hypothetical protein